MIKHHEISLVQSWSVYALLKNTLLTLWPVDDAATAEFMRRFFSRLQKGETQIAALVETKREFTAHPKWHAPLYWAGFVLYGV